MKSVRYFAILLLNIAIGLVTVQAQSVYKDTFAHTYSIVARDTVTGEMAVAVQSHWFSVGTIVSWGKSGVGVVATQSFVNPMYGPEGLKLMASGSRAEDALNQLLATDSGEAVRQVAMLDHNGNVAAHTGDKCIASAGHIIGDNFSVQANMMLNDDVVPAMAEAYRSNSHLPLAQRVLKAMFAAQEAGGDIRGKQSAVLLVVDGEPAQAPWLDKKIDLRVDDSKSPLTELERLLNVHLAYEHLNRGDVAMEEGDMEGALNAYAAAQAMFPNNLEMTYWKAVTLANNGRLEDALPLFKSVFQTDGNWRTLTERLPASGLLNLNASDLKRVLDL